jgi:hypothetical protein
MNFEHPIQKVTRLDLHGHELNPQGFLSPDLLAAFVLLQSPPAMAASYLAASLLHP